MARQPRPHQVALRVHSHTATAVAVALLLCVYSVGCAAGQEYLDIDVDVVEDESDEGAWQGENAQFIETETEKSPTKTWAIVLVCGVVMMAVYHMYSGGGGRGMGGGGHATEPALSDAEIRARRLAALQSRGVSEDVIAGANANTNSVGVDEVKSATVGESGGLRRRNNSGSNLKSAAEGVGASMSVSNSTPTTTATPKKSTATTTTSSATSAPSNDRSKAAATAAARSNARGSEETSVATKSSTPATSQANEQPKPTSSAAPQDATSDAPATAENVNKESETAGEEESEKEAVPYEYTTSRHVKRRHPQSVFDTLPVSTQHFLQLATTTLPPDETQFLTELVACHATGELDDDEFYTGLSECLLGCSKQALVVAYGRSLRTLEQRCAFYEAVADAIVAGGHAYFPQDATALVCLLERVPNTGVGSVVAEQLALVVDRVVRHTASLLSIADLTTPRLQEVLNEKVHEYTSLSRVIFFLSNQKQLQLCASVL